MPIGLLKGSITAERPRTLRRLRNVYGQTACGMGNCSDGGGEDRLEDGEVAFRLSGDRDRDRDEKSLSIMSPFDEQEEWAKISEIMASFGTGLVRESVFVSELEKEFQIRLGNLIAVHDDFYFVRDDIDLEQLLNRRSICITYYSDICVNFRESIYPRIYIYMLT